LGLQADVCRHLQGAEKAGGEWSGWNSSEPEEKVAAKEDDWGKW